MDIFDFLLNETGGFLRNEQGVQAYLIWQTRQSLDRDTAQLEPAPTIELGAAPTVKLEAVETELELEPAPTVKLAAIGEPELED